MENISKNFVIGIGGTGMRCLESFTHMCAMGLFDGQEFNVLTLDTDYQNGNKARTERLIELYNSIKKTPEEESGHANMDTFFSAKLNLFKCVADYSGNKDQGSPGRNLKDISKLQDGKDSQVLADLFLSRRVQVFDLAHGYRAQTHLGSYLMYHAILDIAARLGEGKNVKEQDEDFGRFLDLLMRAGENAKVFVFGSVFGGTGASSIPVIPRALKDAIPLKIKNGALHDETKFGSTLLTEYFEFKPPTEEDRSTQEDAIIADASFFTLNSQAALSFYDSDPTVKKSYKKMYHIGWPMDAIDYSKDTNESKTITGGKNQKNDCHLVDLLSATAAWDFFNNSDDLSNTDFNMYFKSLKIANNNIDIHFNDVLGDGKNAQLFTKKFNSFYRFMHLVLSVANGATGSNDGVKAFLSVMKAGKIDKYDSITDDFTKKLNQFLREFGYSLDSQNGFKKGWIYQIKNSFNGKFVLDNSSFVMNPKSLGGRFNFGKLYPDDHELNWKDGSVFGEKKGSDWSNDVVEEIKKVSPSPETQILNNTEETFIAHIYTALTSIKNN